MAANNALKNINPLALFAAAYGGTAALQKGVGFVVFIWLARSLPVEEYAQFGLLFALQSGLGALAVAGIFESAIGALKSRHSQQERMQVYAGANACFVILAAVSVAVVALLCPLLLSHVAAQWLDLVAVVVGGLLAAFFSLQSGLVRLEEMHGAALTVSFVGPLAGFVAGAVAFAALHSVTSFFVGCAAGMVLAQLAFIQFGLGVYGVTARSAQVHAILSRLGPFLLIAVLGWLSGYGNTYLVKSLFNATQVARFTFAYTLSSILQLVASSINQVWSPRFLRLVHTLPIEAVERSNKRFSMLQGIAVGLVGAATLAAVPLMLQWLGGNLSAYRGMTLETLLLFSAYAVSIPWWHVQSYYYAHSQGAELMYATLVGSAVGLALWLVAMWLFGVVGVYIGFLLQMAMRTLSSVWLARRKWAIRIAWEGTTLAQVLLLAGAGIAAILQSWAGGHSG